MSRWQESYYLWAGLGLGLFCIFILSIAFFPALSFSGSIEEMVGSEPVISRTAAAPEFSLRAEMTPTAAPTAPSEMQPLVQVIPTRVNPRQERVKLLFGGDVVEGRWGDKPEWHPPLAVSFTHLLPLFRTADLVYFNAEGGLCDPLSDDIEVTPRGRDVLWVEPASLLEIQSSIGQTKLVLGQANNHSMNLGEACERYGRERLEAAGVRVVGAGENLEAARQPFVTEIRKTKIGILAYADTDVLIDAWVAKGDQAGIAPMDMDLLREDLRKLRPRVDFLIVTMHGGKEFEKDVTKHQARFALTAMRYGADLVIGHGPHVVQGVLEVYEGLIYFSLGNGMMDQCFPEEYAYYSEEVRYNVWLEVEILGSEIKTITHHAFYSDRCMMPESAPFEISTQIERRLSSPTFAGDWPWPLFGVDDQAAADARLEAWLNDN